MPLIILTGYPCSGLTYRARQLSRLLEAAQDEFLASTADSTTDKDKIPRYKIHVVPSHDASYPRTVYDNARTEKEARGVAYARAKRMLGRDSIVILDGMNYIKGWRYQLWCEAKAAGTTCCVVHVGTPIDQCVANNEARLRRREKQQEEQQKEKQEKEREKEEEDKRPPPSDTQKEEAQKDQIPEQVAAEGGRADLDDEDPYPPELLNNLIYRYEEPSTHNRWDKPLFTVPWSDAAPPVGDIWAAITGTTLPTSSSLPSVHKPISNLLSSETADSRPSDAASVAPSTATTTARTATGALLRPKIKPHQATVQPAATDPTALYNMEKRTSAVISTIRSFTLANPSAEAALAQSPDGGRGITIPMPADVASTSVFIPAHVVASATTDELAGAGGILALPRLQRLRRQWVGLNRAYVAQNQGQGKGALSADQVGDAFVRFLNAEFAGEGGQVVDSS